MSVTQTFRANLRKAIRDRTELTVGGGQFSGSELAVLDNAFMPNITWDWMLENAAYGIDEQGRPVLTLPLAAPDELRDLPAIIYEEIYRG